MNLIACVGQYNWSIGYDNKLLYRIPEDMERFKRLTINNIVIMGRNTYESIGKPLRDRFNIIVSKSMSNLDIDSDSFNSYVVKSVEDAMYLASYFDMTKDLRRTFVIGGESIYKEMLSMCDTAFITQVTDDDLKSPLEEDLKADRFFPNLYEDREWEYCYDKEFVPYNMYKNYKYVFTEFKRISYGFNV